MPADAKDAPPSWWNEEEERTEAGRIADKLNEFKNDARLLSPEQMRQIDVVLMVLWDLSEPITSSGLPASYASKTPAP